jgi:hypothetical protein
MRTPLLLFLALTAAAASAAPSEAPIAATGTLYLTFDIGMGNHTEGVLFGRFVPDASSLPHFPAVTSGEYPGPVRYISFRPTKRVLEVVVGATEAARLAHDRERIVQIPVRLVLTHYKAVVECDARTYHATLVSVKPLGSYQVVSHDSAPIGC